MENDSKKEERGLNEGNRNLIVGSVVVLLLIFGPIEPYGLFVRFAYLILIPILFWLVLRYWGNKLALDKQTNDYLNRSIFTLIAGILLICAYSSYVAKSHTACDQYARNGECVGDYITVKGGDLGEAIMLLLLAGIPFYMAISKRKEEE